MKDFNSINWKSFKYSYFQSKENQFHNFNPGTMGSCSNYVIDAMDSFIYENRNPLDIYIKGRQNLQKIRSEAEELWPNSDYEMAIGGSTTYWCNKLSDSFQKIWKASDPSNPIRIISSTHEHKGALLNFENNPLYKVLKIEDKNLNDFEKLKVVLSDFDPNIVLFSQKTWDQNVFLPVQKYFKIVKEICPKSIRILDSAQCLGIDKIEFGCSEIIVTSGHKWLFGPQGSGFMWIHKSVIEVIPRFHYGEMFDSNSMVSIFEESGGQNFTLYAGIVGSLYLFKQIGQRIIKDRSLLLAQYFYKLLQQSNLSEIFKITQNDSVLLLDWIKPIKNKPYEYYQSLHKARVYCKFIKISEEEKLIHRLRFGIPYYENKETILEVANKMQSIMEEMLKND